MADKTSNQAEKATPSATDFTNYYYFGRRDSTPGKLLARSSTAPWEAPRTGGTFDGPVAKGVFTVKRRHPLNQKLDDGLRENILAVLTTMNPCDWRSVDYLRLGYDYDVEENNPVVVWITVARDRVSPTEAQRIVDAISAECKK